MILGITGSIGSGKTTAANLFKKYGFKVINADEIAHNLIQKNPSIYSHSQKFLEKTFVRSYLHSPTKSPKDFVGSVYKKLRDFFGDEILDKNKNIDRSRLGDIVFNDEEKLKEFNSIMHPAIIKEINYQKNSLKENFFNNINIIIDAPLLLETGAKSLVDKIVVVKANRKNILKRLKNKYPKEKIEKILNLQMPLKKKLRYADFVINNDKDLNHLRNQVENIVSYLNS